MKKTDVMDHLGNTYKTFVEMCDSWGISYPTFHSRMKRGLSLEEALTKEVHHVDKDELTSHKIEDHLGNTFKTYKDMCLYHKVSYSTFINRKRQGLPIKLALMPYKKEL